MAVYPTTQPNTIPYDSPSGSINVSKWIPPFQPAVGGFGYMGVLAEDTGDGTLQCHECGKWFEQLPTHLVSHGLTATSYRAKFGLLTQTALKSKRLRLIQSEVMSNFRKTGKKKFLRKFKKKNTESANRKGKAKAMESQNIYGVCDLQILTKVQALATRLGRTPTLVELKREYGQRLISVMYMRYGSYVQYCREKLKMEPGFSNFNKKYSREYFIEKGVDAALNNQRLKVKSLFNQSEQRHLYRYFDSWKTWEKDVTQLLDENK